MDKEQRISELVNILIETNESYRLGTPLISDKEYDLLIDELTELDPENPFLNKVGIELPNNDSRKEKLPVKLGSMNKVKTVAEIHKWCRSKNIPLDEYVVLTAKLDGLTLETFGINGNAWTRGDGEFGQNSKKHYEQIKINNDKHVYPDGDENRYTIGEVIISKKVFEEKYKDQFENPRNAVSGLLNSDYDPKLNERLLDCSYIRYNLVDTDIPNDYSKANMIGILNEDYNTVKIPCKVLRINELTEELLLDLFTKWSTEYEIDGIVIEVNDCELRQKLGLETNSLNPAYARAYKGNFEEVGETKVLAIKEDISKQGHDVPVAVLEPISLNGVTITNVTCNNMKQILDMGINIGCTVKIKRSGMVIPFIIEVTKPNGTYQLPTRCPSCGSELTWNENNVHLVCNNSNCKEKQIKQIISFFSILDVDGLREATCRLLYECGFDTVKKILLMTKEDFLSLPSFAEKKSETLYNEIQKKISNVELGVLMHATSIFKSLGSRKLLELTKQFKNNKPSVNEVKQVEGFSDITANEYVNNFDRVMEFINDLPLKYKEINNNINHLNNNNMETNSSVLKDQVFVFTGIRRADLEDVIKLNGGEVGSGVTKKTTCLVMKLLGSGSSKEKKAQEMGIEILTVEQLEEKFEKLGLL
jgi:DNA ligase (NAD+)